MIKVDTSGLNRFISKVKAFKDINAISENLAKKIAMNGVEKLENKYNAMTTDNERPIVYAEIESKTARIVASGKDVMFEEFGTGRVGEQSNYEGNLPTSGIPITGAWQYYYPSKAKTIVDGQEGWYVPFGVSGQNVDEKGFTTGMKSQHQIFDTARELEKEIPDIFSKLLKEGLNNGD